MKKSRDISQKTSRRSFNKTIATALAAVAALSVLSSCKQQDTTNRSTVQTGARGNSNAPEPEPTGTPDTRGNPPIIIDDGSFTINLASRLNHQQQSPADPLSYKYIQENTPANPRRYGAITRVLLMNDTGAKPFDQTLGTPGSPVSVKMWIQIGTEDSAGNVTYPPVNTTDHPDFLLNNVESDSFQFWYGRHSDDRFSSPEKHLKKNRPHWRYEVKDKKTGGPNGQLFRVGRVEITANSMTHTVGEDEAGLGFRVIIELQDAP